jgi:hypothetical protein
MNTASRLGKIRIWLPPETPLRARLHLWWKVIVFVWKFEHATKEDQDRMIAFLKNQPGVTMTERKIS